MENKEESMQETLKKLNDALEAGKYNAAPISSKISAEDRMDMAKKYLTAQAFEDISRKSTTLFVPNGDGSGAICIYLGALVRKGNEEKAVKRLSEVLNELSAEGSIHSALAPMQSIDLAKTANQELSTAVISFVLVPTGKQEEIKQRYADLSLAEGEMPKPIEDTKLALEEGEFVSIFRVSHIVMMGMADKSASQYIQEHVELLLSVLPKGTRLVKTTECAITDLSASYELVFQNPLLKRVSEVQLNYVRTVEIVGEKLEEFNLLTGVRYLDADKKELFK